MIPSYELYSGNVLFSFLVIVVPFFLAFLLFILPSFPFRRKSMGDLRGNRGNALCDSVSARALFHFRKTLSARQRSFPLFAFISASIESFALQV